MNEIPPPELLAIVEVVKDDRIQCQAEGCGHPVYKRIHVVREDGRVSLYGSDCFARLFEKAVAVGMRPRYGTSEGRPLTADERAMLAENAERLIARFEAEDAALREREAAAMAAAAVAQPARTRQSLPLARIRFPTAPDERTWNVDRSVAVTSSRRASTEPTALSPYQERQAHREALRVLRQRPDLLRYGEAAVTEAMVAATAICLGWGLQTDQYTQQTIDIEAERILASGRK